MDVETHSALISRLRAFSWASSIFVIVVGCLVLLGWLFDIPLLKSVVPGLPTMKANSALGFLLTGCSLWLLNRAQQTMRVRLIALTLSVVVALLGAAVILEYAFDIDTGMDKLLFPGAAANEFAQRKMAPATAVCFFLVGISLSSLDFNIFRYRPATVLAVSSLVVSILALVGYAYKVDELYRIGSYSSMALHTAVSFLVVSVGVLASRPETGLMQLVSSDALGSVMLRRILPVAILIPAFLGWLLLVGQQADLFDVAFGVAAFAISNILIISVLLFWTAGSINVMDSVRKRSEEDLRAAENRYRSTLDHMQEGCQIIRFDFRYLYVNDVAARQGRSTKEDLIGSTMMEKYPGIESSEMFALLRDCMDNRVAHQLENEFTFPDGTKGWFFLSMEPVPEGTFILSTDITEQKLQEQELKKHRDHLEDLVKERTAQLEAANRELEAFSYSVSHDLRAPLRHINGFVELLQKKISHLLDEQGGRYLTTISQSAKRMGVLIDDLLAFSRMGRAEMRMTTVDLGQMVQDVIQDLKTDAEGRDIEWSVSDLPSVRGDKAMLRLAILNLASNALKYTRTRTRALIEIGCEKVTNGDTVFFVRDNGVGFDMRYVDKLFGVFQRLHRDVEFEGTGIGLANVRRIINRHNGTTWAESTLDNGATFYFSLPRRNH